MFGADVGKVSKDRNKIRDQPLMGFDCTFDLGKRRSMTMSHLISLLRDSFDGFVFSASDEMFLLAKMLRKLDRVPWESVLQTGMFPKNTFPNDSRNCEALT